MITNQIRDLAKVLWDYNYIPDEITDADLLLVMGSNDLDVAYYAAEVAKTHSFQHIICSGGVAHTDDLLNTGWDKSECDMFADVMVDQGVANSNIIREGAATNTGDNITLSYQILDDRNISIQTGVIVQKPFMLRRALATAQKQWSDVEWKVISRAISYEEYITDKNEEDLINILVGDTERHAIYAEKGFQTHQDMPKDVLLAKTALIKRGYSKHLPKLT